MCVGGGGGVHPATLSLKSAHFCELNVLKPLYFNIFLLFLEKLNKLHENFSFLSFYQLPRFQYKLYDSQNI